MTAATDATAAIQAVADGIGAFAADPGDGIRLLLALADAPRVSASALGIAVAARCRRAALIAACRLSSAWQPASSDDAQAMMALLVAVLDAEITTAGDGGDDASFGALEALRAAVITDLSARGAGLATLMGVSYGAVLPSLVIANRLYADAAREPELVQRVDPIHPLFMPLAMRVLAR